MVTLKKLINILAIDTSCDETSVAVTRGVSVLANSLYSQLDLHKQYGGVVPGIAKLAHIEKFDSVLQEALVAAGITLEQIDAVAVTQGPGLAIALEVGIDKAKEIAANLNVPLIAMNHMEGHMLSALAVSEVAGDSQEIDVEFPVLGLLVSGGHTEYVEVFGLNKYRKLGGTVDDACGEAYDKCARMLGLPYPGGPLISQLAEKYRSELNVKFEKDQRSLMARGYKDGAVVFELPVPMAFTGDLNLSYSGLKTSVKHLINRLSNESYKLDLQETAKQANLAESTIGLIAVVFEAAAIKMLTLKLEQAIIESRKPVAAAGFKEVWLGGGVVASDFFRAEVQKVCDLLNVRLRMPATKKLMTDNAAMIGIAAGVKVSSLLEQESVSTIAELPSDVQLANAIYAVPQEFNLLERDPILSL